MARPGPRKDPTPAGPEPTPNARGLWLGLIAYSLVGLVAVWAWSLLGEQGGYRPIPYSDFKAHLARGEVEFCALERERIRGRILPSGIDAEGESGEWTGDEAKPGDPFLFRTVRVEDPGLVDQLIAQGVEFKGTPTPVLGPALLGWLLPLLLIAGLWIFMTQRARSGGPGLMGFSKSQARLIADRETGVSFDDVAGCDEAKEELGEVIEFLRDPSRFRALGAHIPKGVLLVGPPGTGKTLLARAVAGEARVPFYSLSGSEFVEMFVGVGAARVRDLFEQAKRQAPCIVFIDELDAVGRQRGIHVVPGNDEREQTLNQLLVEMDGFEPNAGVILLAATNRPETLDKALLRPGRFDRQVVLDAPDAGGRVAILRVHTRDKPLSEDVNLEKVARATPGFSGADLANVVNEAALLAARVGATTISQQLLEEAVEKVVAGPERKSRRLSDEDKRRVAHHEVGHALVASYCAHADPVHKISIVPRGRAALGYTLQLPTGDQLLMSRSELLDRICALLGGRASEELIFDEVSTGSQNDLQQATTLAREMVTKYGMGRSAGLMECAPDEVPFVPGTPVRQLDCSEATAREIDAEVMEILSEAYEAARAILREHRATLEHIAQELLRKETLDAQEFKRLLAEASVR